MSKQLLWVILIIVGALALLQHYSMRRAGFTVGGLVPRLRPRLPRFIYGEPSTAGASYAQPTPDQLQPDVSLDIGGIGGSAPNTPSFARSMRYN